MLVYNSIYIRVSHSAAMSSLVARLGSLSLRAGRSAPAQKAAAAPAALLSARRCASLSAGAAELRAQPGRAAPPQPRPLWPS